MSVPRPHDARRAQTIRIYLKHHNDPDNKFQPREKVCSDYTDGKNVTHRGCGATTLRYVTYPNEKGMMFDSEPRIVEGSEAHTGNGGIVAAVYVENVHFGTCPMRNRSKLEDGKQAAGGERVA